MKILKQTKNKIKLRRIENKNNRKSAKFDAYIKVIDALLLLVFIAVFSFIFFLTTNTNLKIASGILTVMGILLYIFKKLFIDERKINSPSEISKLILIDSEGERLREWHIENESSLLIGKSSSDNEVDIDLLNSEYEELISTEHAVINFSLGNWYIEDLDSRNGVGLKKANEVTNFKIAKDRPFKIEVGDVIYIAKTRLLVR